MDDDKRQRIATFRFGVIHDLVGHVELDPGEQERLIREKCARKWVIPFSEKTSISRGTVIRWMKRTAAGLELTRLCAFTR